MVEDWENTDKRQLSDKSTNGTDSNGAQRSEEKAGILVDEDDTEGNSSRQDDHDSYSIDLRDHFTCNPPPSYMRSKSGVEMDPDRFRRRKKMITRLPEAQSAIDRMRLIATHWDTDKNGQLLGFDCVSLDPTQFKELFRRNFGVLLTAKDLGILVSMYDKRGEGKADSTEFIKDFWQMGREARNLHNRKRMATVRNMRLKHEARMKQRADRMSRLKEVAVGEHTGKDAETAVAKITEIASCYDTMRDNSFRHLEQGGVMGPTMFREQLRRIFCLRLTRAEVAGLVTAFNLHRDGMVDAKEFARRFHELGRKKRAARVAEGHMKNELARQQKRDEEKALLARIREQSKVKIKWDFTQDELERGKAMIAKAASTYIKGRMGGDVLGIAQMKMDPAAFRAQLMQHFRVRLGPGELGAVFRKFDKDKSMLIDGTELMNEFFRLGREERARRLAEINNQKRRIKEREKEFRSRLENRFLEQTVAKVIWPSLPRDPYDEDHSMNDTRTLNRRGGWERGSHRSVSTGEASRCTTGIKGKGDNSCLPSRSGTVELLRARSWWKRSDLNTSNSTADFLTQIEKEEVAIQTMTCGISHQRRDILSSAAEVGCLSSQPERLYPAGMPQQQWLHRESRRRQNNGRDDNDAVAPSLVPLRKHESMLLLSAQSDDLGDQGGAIEKQNPSRPSTALDSLAPGTGDQIFGSADISTVPDTGGSNRGLNTNDPNILAVESGG